MDIDYSPNTYPQEIRQIKFGSCVLFEGDYWLFADDYPDTLLVRITDGKQKKLDMDGECEIEVVDNATLTFN